MLFPTNPEKRPELWDNFSEKVAAGSTSFIVHKGHCVIGPYVEEAELTVNHFRNADVVRFGADRGQAIGPFFALEVDGEVAQLNEYAIDSNIQSNSSDAIQEAMQSLAINIFFERKDIKEIIIPFKLAGWDIIEWSAVMDEGRTKLLRTK